MPGACAKCGAPNADKKCSKCYVVVYCCKECQREHWKAHKKQCSTLANERHKREDEENANGATSKTAAAQQQVAPAASQAQPDHPRPVQTTSTAAPSSGPPQAQTQPVPAIQSKPYTAPENLSSKGKELYAKLKPILEGLPEEVADSIAKTEYCLEVDGDRRRVDTRVIYLLSDYIREAIIVSPETTSEAFKRMLAVRMFLNHEDYFLFANWCSILGAVALSEAAKTRLEALGRKYEHLPPGADPSGKDLPEEVEAQVKDCRTDAVVFLSMGLTFLDNAEKQKPPPGKQAPPSEIMFSMRSRMSIVLAYALRHIPEGVARRAELLKHVASLPRERTDSYTRALANYSLAHIACIADDADEFNARLAAASEAFTETGNMTVQAFIDSHREHGCSERCAVEMGGVMDGTESQFGAQVLAGIMPKEGKEKAAAAAAAAAVGHPKAGGVSRGGGAKLGDEGKGAGKATAAAKPAAANGARRPDTAAKELEAEVKAGYDMYQRGEMEAGIEHFARVLKKAYELEKTGMSISIIFSASHAHIEGCAQLGRYGKAENTVLKLKELAEYTDSHAIPYSIETISDRLHLWWREKRAGLYSRQRQYRKAFETLDEAVLHAANIAKHFEASVHVLRCSCLVDLAFTGSSTVNMSDIQKCLDSGIECLREDPPPAGGQKAAAETWANEAKLDLWVRLLPMLRSLEIEGVDTCAAEDVLLPLAERFDLEVGETVENAETFVLNNMHTRSGWGGLAEVNCMTVLFGLAVVLPLLLALMLAVRSLLPGPPLDAAAAADADGASEGL